MSRNRILIWVLVAAVLVAGVWIVAVFYNGSNIGNGIQISTDVPKDHPNQTVFCNTVHQNGWSFFTKASSDPGALLMLRIATRQAPASVYPDMVVVFTQETSQTPNQAKASQALDRVKEQVPC